MPLCHLYTTRNECEVKCGTEMRLAETVAEALKKPLDRVTVLIHPGTRMLRQGTLDPSCVLVIHSINVFDAERNPAYIPPIKEMLQRELNLPPERCVLQFVDLDANFVG